MKCFEFKRTNSNQEYIIMAEDIFTAKDIAISINQKKIQNSIMGLVHAIAEKRLNPDVMDAQDLLDITSCEEVAEIIEPEDL